MGRKAELLIVTALAIATPAHAADRQTISIAPSRLGEAVVALGRQTGVSVGMSDQSLAGIATPAVKGRLSVDAALKRLLRGSGARAMMIDASTWRPSASRRPLKATDAPSRAKARATDSPMPDVAPVTMTDRPAKRARGEASASSRCARAVPGNDAAPRPIAPIK